jgi:hypothetical protein
MNTQTTTNLPQSGSKTKSLAAACLLVLTAAAQADLISINFGGGPVVNPLDAYFSQPINWNSWTTGATSQTNLINSAGVPVADITVIWNDSNGSQNNNAFFGSPVHGSYNSTFNGNPFLDPYICVPGDAGYYILNNTGGGGNTNYAQFKVTGLPAGSQVAALGNWLGNGNQWGVETASGAQHSWLTWAGQQFTTQLVTELNGTQTFYFNGQTPGAGVNNQDNGGISAIQIVTPVPEPGTAVSLLGGLGMLLGLRRRRA